MVGVHLKAKENTEKQLTTCVINEKCYCLFMIKSFQCKETKKIFGRKFSKKLPTDIQANARQKLVILDSATSINDLRIPPDNMLEEGVRLTKEEMEKYAEQFKRSTQLPKWDVIIEPIVG